MVWVTLFEDFRVHKSLQWSTGRPQHYEHAVANSNETEAYRVRLQSFGKATSRTRQSGRKLIRISESGTGLEEVQLREIQAPSSWKSFRIRA